MPIGYLLVLVRHIQHLRFHKIIANDVQTDRSVFISKTDGNRHCRQTSQIGSAGVDIR